MSLGTTISGFWSKHKTLVIIIILGILVIIFLQAFLHARQTTKDLNNLINNQDSTMRTYKDKNGILHSQIEIATGNAAAIDIYYKKQLDSLSTLIKVKDNQILDYTKIIKTTVGSFKTRIDTVVFRDTVKLSGKTTYLIDTNYIMQYKDNWLNFLGTYAPRTQSFTGDYKLVDSLSFVTFAKPTGFLNLGKTVYYLDVFSSNPNESITNLKSLKVVEMPPHRFGIGPFLGATYSNGTVKPVIGLGVSYSIFRF